MASRSVSDAEFKKALDLHCVASGLTASEGEDHGVKRFLLSPGDIIVRLEGGRIVCDSQSTYEKLAEVLMDMRAQEPASAPNPGQKEEKGLVPSNGKSSGQGFTVDSWRQRQDRSYNVAGKQAPNAFAASEEANRRGLCTQIIDSGRTKELAWGQVRVLDPKTGQYREDRVSHEKETFMLLKSWEDAESQARYMKGQQLIIGISENNMPILDGNIKIKGSPAPLWLAKQLARAWSFADRDAITKAERRAQLKILNREWREDEEINLEIEEEKAVSEAMGRRG